MKIRIQGNSIRYRLRQPEVENFKRYGSVTEVIQLGKESTDQLRFILQKSPGNEITVQFENATTTIHVPQPMADTWTDSDLVGFDAISEIYNGDGLQVLIEKDFKCLDGSDEDNIDAYPNPAK
ncbi:MAG TPA: hypothetical protein VL095_04070 [Flavisolibacter sp.]|nr:hypothetical protein [Flavisolibacter sp.]